MKNVLNDFQKNYTFTKNKTCNYVSKKCNNSVFEFSTAQLGIKNIGLRQ